MLEKQKEPTDLVNCSWLFIMICFSFFFQPKPGYQNNLKVLYSQKNTPGSTQKTGRYIASMSDRILDAPDIRNDYCKQPRSLRDSYYSRLSSIQFWACKGAWFLAALEMFLLCGGLLWKGWASLAFGHCGRWGEIKLYLTGLWLSHEARGKEKISSDFFDLGPVNSPLKIKSKEF